MYNYKDLAVMFSTLTSGSYVAFSKKIEEIPKADADIQTGIEIARAALSESTDISIFGWADILGNYTSKLLEKDARVHGNLVVSRSASEFLENLLNLTVDGKKVFDFKKSKERDVEFNAQQTALMTLIDYIYVRRTGVISETEAFLKAAGGGEQRDAIYREATVCRFDYVDAQACQTAKDWLYGVEYKSKFRTFGRDPQPTMIQEFALDLRIQGNLLAQVAVKTPEKAPEPTSL